MKNEEAHKIRIFIGIACPDDLKEKINQWQKEHKKKFPVRWIDSNNIHLTLIPPWWVENIGPVVIKLEQIKNNEYTCEIPLEKIEYGPNPKQPRLIWITGKPHEKLNQLKTDLEKIFEVDPPKREFIPHITIARFKKDNMKFYKEIKLEEQINWDFKIETLTLFQSTLKPTGAEYTPLKKIQI
ncbi:RNA 2',3'-cyclic phosphodiesterase [Candidatus Margulisiibacteriota bacterium]